jgi:hypothetical protein
VPAQRIVKLRKEKKKRSPGPRRKDFAVEAEADDDKTTTHPSYVV